MPFSCSYREWSPVVPSARVDISATIKKLSDCDGISLGGRINQFAGQIPSRTPD